MAEDEDGVANRKSPQNSENAGPSQDNEPNTIKPDLGIEEAKYDGNENGESSPTEPSSTPKSTGAMRKDDNPFSFRHFLKRDLSLPGNSTYENTGARPKVYANTVQHSPTKLDLHETRRDRARAETSRDFHTKETTENCRSRISEIPSTSSVEIPLSAVENNSQHNIYTNSDVPFYHRPNLASEPLGMPSLPDFVQDHILVEQAYLNSNGPISVDLENLPDFTFNTSYNSSSPSIPTGRANNGDYRGRIYDYEPYLGAAVAAELGVSREVPLDLPAGAEAVGPMAEPPHLNLDLTESVNPADRRNMSPRNNFDNPLDLPPNAGTESMRLPDFLPVRAGAGRTSPENDHTNHTQEMAAELERIRSELFSERARRCRLEDELQSQREAASLLRAEAAAARAAEAELRLRLTEGGAAAECCCENASRPTDSEQTIAKLKREIKRLKEELSSARAETLSLRRVQSGAATGLRQAATHADSSLRDLLAGLEQLRALSSALDPT